MPKHRSNFIAPEPTTSKLVITNRGAAVVIAASIGIILAAGLIGATLLNEPSPVSETIEGR